MRTARRDASRKGISVISLEEGPGIAVVDRIGHGEEAAAANAAIRTLQNSAGESISAIMLRCQESLRNTRGLDLSIVSLDVEHSAKGWPVVNRVQAFCFRGWKARPEPEALGLPSRRVGSQFPPAREKHIRAGERLVFFTHGMRPNVVEHLPFSEAPLRAPNTMLEQFHGGHDDALVLMARRKGMAA